MSRAFHLGDLLTVVDGHVVGPNHVHGIYDVVDYVTGQDHMTHQLPRASQEITPWLLGQHPWLADITVPDDLDGEAGVRAWLGPLIEQYGEQHTVEPMPPGMYVGRDPVAELLEMAAGKPVIAVTVDPDAVSG